jgi:hypothetical protein
MTREEIAEAVAKGWCHPDTEYFVMNPILAHAIVEEIWKADISPNLGCATTKELVDELKARADEWPRTSTKDLIDELKTQTDEAYDEAWTKYKTIDSH